MFIIFKSQIKNVIKKERSKQDKETRKELTKKHQKEMTKIIAKYEKRLAITIKTYKLALSNRDRQHRNDIKVYGSYKADKDFFRIFREKYAPEILEMQRRLGGFFFHINEGEDRVLISDKKDSINERRLRVI